MWYDDPETLALKYQAALGGGVAALGVWTADSAGDEPNTTAPMWAAIPALPTSQRSPWRAAEAAPLAVPLRSAFVHLEEVPWLAELTAPLLVAELRLASDVHASAFVDDWP